LTVSLFFYRYLIHAITSSLKDENEGITVCQIVLEQSMCHPAAGLEAAASRH